LYHVIQSSDYYLSGQSGNPAPPDIVQAHHEQNNAKRSKDGQINGKGHNIPFVDGPMKHVRAIGQGEYVGKWF
jgi:hypothetical protein